MVEYSSSMRCTLCCKRVCAVQAVFKAEEKQRQMQTDKGKQTTKPTSPNEVNNTLTYGDIAFPMLRHIPLALRNTCPVSYVGLSINVTRVHTYTYTSTHT